MRFLGFVPDATLAVLYRLASVFVFPSLYEGFGLPPLEAMAAGTPVITSNVSSLPEVVGDAALLIDPMDAGAIADAMARVLGDAALRAELIRRGRERVKAFSWDRSVARVSAGLRRARRRARACLSPPPPTPRLAGRRVVLVHDWLTGMRGGEKVLESLCRLLPDAELLHAGARHGIGVAADRVATRSARRSSSGCRSPARCYRHYLPLFPTAIELFDLDDADLVVSTSHCAAKAVVPTGRARAPLLLPLADAVCVGSVRRLLRRRSASGRVGNAVARPVLAWLARWDRATAHRVDRFVANSRYVAGRIARYYNRRASVLHPPVDTQFFTPDGAGPAPYFLVVSALVPYKRIDVAIDAANRARRAAEDRRHRPGSRAAARARPAPASSSSGSVDDETLRDALPRARRRSCCPAKRTSASCRSRRWPAAGR